MNLNDIYVYLGLCFYPNTHMFFFITVFLFDMDMAIYRYLPCVFPGFLGGVAKRANNKVVQSLRVADRLGFVDAKLPLGR